MCFLKAGLMAVVYSYFRRRVQYFMHAMHATLHLTPISYRHDYLGTEVLEFFTDLLEVRLSQLHGLCQSLVANCFGSTDFDDSATATCAANLGRGGRSKAACCSNWSSDAVPARGVLPAVHWGEVLRLRALEAKRSKKRTLMLVTDQSLRNGAVALATTALVLICDV